MLMIWCLPELERCPPEVRIALKSSQVSFDVTVIDEGGKPHFFEFHEEQHAAMTVARRSVLYNALREPVTVPRYIQRLYAIFGDWRMYGRFRSSGPTGSMKTGKPTGPR